MARQMLLFTIGPVQPFIEQARKTRDLWTGSFLLADLMQAAMSQFIMKGQEEPSPKLIFPARPKTSQRIPSLPNKFVAILEDEKEARDVANEAERLLRERWERIAAQVWELLESKVAAINAAHDIWKRQIRFEGFFEVHWAITSEQPGALKEEPYGQWFTRTRRALEARKRLRNFEPQGESQPGEKSTISGERQALRGEKGDLPSVKKFWKDIAGTGEFSEAQINHDGSERLDAIDTIKRFAALARTIPNLSYPSTSTVAAAPFIEALVISTSSPLDEPLLKWKDLTRGELAKMPEKALPYLHKKAGENTAALDILRRDGDCYFLETFTPQRLEGNYGLPNYLKSAEELVGVPKERLERTKALVNQAPAVLARLRETLPDEQSRLLTPYYAVLKMDGDRMGTLLESVESREEHKEISRALSTFASDEAQACKIVEEDYPAKLVYAGGDDVLALVPMRHALNLSKQLQETYVKMMGPPTEALRARAKQRGESLHVTMSAGIAIAHYLDPLSHVLHEVRRAEDQAKKRYGRNAVVVKLLRHSGEPTTVGCNWRYPGLPADAQPIPLFQEVQGLLESKKLSNKCVYSLAEDAATLCTFPLEAQVSQIRRQLMRGRKNKEALPDDAADSLARRLAALAEAMDPKPKQEKSQSLDEEDEPDEEDQRNGLALWGVGPRRGLVELSGWLLLMAFLQRGGRD